MRTSWTREMILRHILQREAEGQPLTTGGEGVDHNLYCASRRIFGSWRNAIIAAGIPPERVLTWERWSPAKILSKIRLISRRRRPLTSDEIERRYHNLVSAARRHFGSWSKAVLAAGVDPTKLQRVVPWSRERVIEAILTRTLRNEPLVARLIEPRSLVDAGHRFFGSWRAAVSAAGMDPRVTELPPRRKKKPARVLTRVATPKRPRKQPPVWTDERILQAIVDRVREGKRINSWAVSRDHASLYRTARRHFGTWDAAIRAAGFDPLEHRRDRGVAPRSGPSDVRRSQRNDAVRPEVRE